MQKNRLLSAQVAQLRAEARADRNKLRDLRNENFLLKDRIDTAKVERTRIGIPKLPVETRRPDPTTTTTAAANNSRPGYQVVGVDRHGSEIVYVGAASRNDSIRPKITGHGSPERTRSGRRLESVPVVTDRLPVSKSIPTIQNQLNKTTTRVTGPVSDPQTDYQRYYRALRAGNHAYAITGFRNFIKRYPRHDYADNAQYWLGEAFYDRKDYDKALSEFRRVVTRYPRGNKVPDALLKIGLTYTSLKQPAKARSTFKQIVTVYPKGRPAELASAQLAKLSKTQ